MADLRGWLSTLESHQLLFRVAREVDPRFELAAVLKRLDGSRAGLFERVRGHAAPVLGNALSSRQMVALAVGAKTPADVLQRLGHAVATPIAPVVVGRDDSPVRQTVEPTIDLGRLPLPTHHELDSGPYISAGIVIAKNSETGQRNVSIQRFQLSGPDRLGIYMAPRHLWELYREAEARDRALDIAIAIGVHPALSLASQVPVPFGVDELGIAGALLEQPVRLVRGETVDLEVPADAEIVIEGRILPGVREDEGPFGEFPRTYGPRTKTPVVQVTAVLHRRDFIFQTTLPASREHLLLGGIPREAALLDALRKVSPRVRAVNLTFGGSCRFHAVVALDKQVEGEPKNVLLAALASHSDVKQAIAVDSDVDIFDTDAVEWAVATRFQADRDLLVVPGAWGSRLDPSARGGVSTKVAIDATMPLGAAPMDFARIRIPGEESVNLDDYTGEGRH